MDSKRLIRAHGQVLPLSSLNDGFYAGGTLFPADYLPIAGTGFSLQECWRILLKRKRIVIACFALIFAMVTAATLRMTPTFQASGRIALNKSDASFTPFNDLGFGNDYEDAGELDTQVKILQSDSLALQVIQQLDLANNLSFAGRNLAGTSGTGKDPKLVSVLVKNFHSNLRVARLPNSRILEITYTGPDPELAAAVVNTVQTTFIEQNFKNKFESTMQTSDWLSKQLVDLQMKVETSQQKLVDFQREHGILGIDEKQNIITSKLDELNKELTGAETDRVEKESLYRMVEGGSPDVLTSLTPRDLPGGAPLSLLDKLRDQKATLEIRRAEMASQFGPAFPQLLQLENQLKQVDAEIQAEVQKTGISVHNQFLAAEAREKMLRVMFEKQKAEANRLNESAITYNILKRDLETNRQLYEGLLQKLKEAGIAAGLRSSNLRIIDQATVPTLPSEPTVPRNLAFGALLGSFLGVLLAFVAESLDGTVHSPEQAQAISSLPALAIIPLAAGKQGDRKNRKLPPSMLVSDEPLELVAQCKPRSQMTESYRSLRTSLLLSSLGTPPKVILISSALPQEGKTTTSMNCAIVLAQKGARVLLMDADMRRPRIQGALGLGDCKGLSEVLTRKAELQDVVTRDSAMPNLDVLPAGSIPHNPSELLASNEMKDLLSDLRQHYDHVVIDSPPALSVTDAAVLSAYADGVVLVIRSGQTPKQALRRSRDLLSQVNAKIRGIVLNAADVNSPDYSQYSEYRGKYSNRYYGEEREQVADSRRSKTA